MKWRCAAAFLLASVRYGGWSGLIPQAEKVCFYSSGPHPLKSWSRQGIRSGSVPFDQAGVLVLCEKRLKLP
ncbi:protein of unknown function [Methylorubrum extorquens]|uniref:Uncharacterized protein n=1 Tax=Methylorubrum extorquens TaxID=408 RepID=A0A2N9AW75_METEX|nr:protein of unknown function [Methylorubrum extorquens]